MINKINQISKISKINLISKVNTINKINKKTSNRLPFHFRFSKDDCESDETIISQINKNWDISLS